jgi:hypothetical protein
MLFLWPSYLDSNLWRKLYTGSYQVKVIKCSYIFETQCINRLEKCFPTSSFVSKCLRQFLVKLKKKINWKKYRLIVGKKTWQINYWSEKPGKDNFQIYVTKFMFNSLLPEEQALFKMSRLLTLVSSFSWVMIITLTELLHVIVFINYTSHNKRYPLSQS